MGMGWKDVDYTYEDNKRKCQCGKGYIIQIKYVYAESEMPPFERYKESFRSTCPNNCENL